MIKKMSTVNECFRFYSSTSFGAPLRSVSDSNNALARSCSGLFSPFFFITRSVRLAILRLATITMYSFEFFFGISQFSPWALPRAYACLACPISRMPIFRMAQRCTRWQYGNQVVSVSSRTVASRALSIASKVRLRIIRWRKRERTVSERPQNSWHVSI